MGTSFSFEVGAGRRADPEATRTAARSRHHLRGIPKGNGRSHRTPLCKAPPSSNLTSQTSNLFQYGTGSVQFQLGILAGSALEKYQQPGRPSAPAQDGEGPGWTVGGVCEEANEVTPRLSGLSGGV